jgi:cell division protein FtsB
VSGVIQRIIWVVLIIGAAYFAMQAGEFSTRDILRQRMRKAQMQAGIDALQHEVDSLTRVERLVRGDSVTQERIAREEFGMVHGDNEILYRFVAPDSADSTAHK